MSYIYGRRDRLKATPLSEALQQEMYCSPYASQDWDKARNLCARPDLYYPHPMVQVGLLFLMSKPIHKPPLPTVVNL